MRFAIRDAALLELMFAGNEREQAGALHVTSGIVAPEQVDSLVGDATARFLHGPRLPS